MVLTVDDGCRITDYSFTVDVVCAVTFIVDATSTPSVFNLATRGGIVYFQAVVTPSCTSSDSTICSGTEYRTPVVCLSFLVLLSQLFLLLALFTFFLSGGGCMEGVGFKQVGRGGGEVGAVSSRSVHGQVTVRSR
jgi:hypothetical protein